MSAQKTRSVHDVDVDLAIEDFEAEWGVIDLGRYGRLRDRDREGTERFLAQYAQQLRCEREAMGYREETARFFGSGEHAGGGQEQRLLTRHWERERQLEAEYGRDQPPVHGTAGVYATCTADAGRRCGLCRAYQCGRVAANRAARRARALCTGTRSSYDAGCRCTRCTAANSAACARWRASSAASERAAA
jgi:hypothetical protein